MVEEALEIHNYLPLNRNQDEDDYIKFLWATFTKLASTNSNSNESAFAIMPFHLLFMTAIQFKILRIHKIFPKKYTRYLQHKFGKKTSRHLWNPKSPFAIALLNESSMVDLLKEIGLSDNNAQKLKKYTVRYRNESVAHATGHIEASMESKITGYLRFLELVQVTFRFMNQKVAIAWLEEINQDDNMGSFLDVNLPSYYLSRHDFSDVTSLLLQSERLDSEQKKHIAEKRLDFGI